MFYLAQHISYRFGMLSVYIINDVVYDVFLQSGRWRVAPPGGWPCSVSSWVREHVGTPTRF